ESRLLPVPQQPRHDGRPGRGDGRGGAVLPRSGPHQARLTRGPQQPGQRAGAIREDGGVPSALRAGRARRAELRERPRELRRGAVPDGPGRGGQGAVRGRPARDAGLRTGAPEPGRDRAPGGPGASGAVSCPDPPPRYNRGMPSRRILLTLCAVLLPLVACGPPPTATVRAAPSFDLADLNGGRATLASMKGKVVVLDFWATW